MLLFPEHGVGGRLFPEGHGRFLNGYYRERGVDVRAQAKVASVRRSDDRLLLAVESIDGRLETLRVNAAVAGLGITPATALAESIGVEVEDGIVVDGALRTAHPAI